MRTSIKAVREFASLRFLASWRETSSYDSRSMFRATTLRTAKTQTNQDTALYCPSSGRVYNRLRLGFNDGWKNHTPLPHIEGNWKRRDGCGLQGRGHKAPSHGCHQSAIC